MCFIVGQDSPYSNTDATINTTPTFTLPSPYVDSNGIPYFFRDPTGVIGIYGNGRVVYCALYTTHEQRIRVIVHYTFHIAHYDDMSWG